MFRFTTRDVLWLTVVVPGVAQIALVVPLNYFCLHAMSHARPVHWAAYPIILPAIFAVAGVFVWANRQLNASNT